MENRSEQLPANRTDGFRWRQADAYLFDIDGTLLNTEDLVHYNARNFAMRDVYRVDIAASEERRIRRIREKQGGPSLDEACAPARMRTS